jgi:RimJ/RimL family protein N-acetyltransferase
MEPIPHAVLDAHPLTLEDGSAVTVRSLRGADGQRIREVFAELGDRSRYLRFGGAKTALTDDEIRYLTDIDNRDHEALLALDSEGAPVGVARYVRDRADPTLAEAAFTVIDAWQGRRLGTSLARLLAGRAHAEGIRRFRLDVLSDNRPGLALARGLGRIVETRREGASVELVVELAVTAA